MKSDCLNHDTAIHEIGKSTGIFDMNKSAILLIKELLEYYSTQQALADAMGLSISTLQNVIASKDVSAVTLEKIFQFFQEHAAKYAQEMSTIDAVELLKTNRAVMVSSPDGFEPIITLHIKKPRPIVTIETVTGKKANGSNDHLFETDNGWAVAEHLKPGMHVLTVDGFEKLAHVNVGTIAEEVFDFEVGHPNHRFWSGDGISSHNSGKSFLAGNAVVQAQKEGYHIVYLDSEHAVDVDYLKKIGAKVDEEYLTYISVTTIEDVNQVLSEFFSGYKKEYGKNNPDSQRVLIVLDSLAMLSSTTEMDNYEKGVIKGDMGQLAKRRKAMLRLAVGQIGNLPITMILTDHVYPADPLDGNGLWAITNSTKFSTSIIGLVTKLKLKEETQVVGVRMRVETYKSRFARLGSKIELEVPYSSGMSPLTGLVDLLVADGVIAKGTQPGEKLSYVAEWTDSDGEIHRVVFREKDLTIEIAERILRGHPKCQPMAGRDEVEIELEDLSVDDED